jgi:hypothetical protein
VSYRVKLTGAQPQPRAEVESYLQRLPDMRKDADVYLYTDAEEDVGIEVRIEVEGENARGLEVHVPIRVSEAAGERAASFCAGLAQRFGWEAKDAATGAPLSSADMQRRFSGGSLVPAKTGGCLSVFLLIFAAGQGALDLLR